MKALGDWVHSQGMKYGLYTCRGTCQCSTGYYQGPGGQGYEAQDSKWLADAGADWAKIDSCCGVRDLAG
jgi:alpha-galactosidase